MIGIYGERSEWIYAERGELKENTENLANYWKTRETEKLLKKI